MPLLIFIAMCLYPKLIKNPKYLPNKKNSFKPPKINDERTLLVPVGCGNCIECRKQNSRQWQIRLNEEIKIRVNKTFVTLTFNEESLDKLKSDAIKLNINHKEQNEIATLGVRRFLERWRKKYKVSVKHWLITELGHTGTERIHLHGLIFSDKIEDIKNIWGYGFVYIGEYVNERTINYIVKYVTKVDKDHPNYKPKILCSKGIGANYLNKHDCKINRFNETETIEYYRTSKGLKLNLPIYYRNKLYNEEEREKLWINKIDKNERWIMGNKIDISISEDEYFKTLDRYQKLNKRLGYEIFKDWEVEHYKKIRATLNRKK